MNYIKKEQKYILEQKKSKFISYIFQYKNFNKVMKKLKNEHSKARHFVYAYRYINDFDQIVENCSDDGEPRGTSGKPSLNVLRGENIINNAIIIVRYFGGIKLGTGGLVKTYSNSVNLLLDKCTYHEYKKLITNILTIKYDMLSKVEYQIKKLDLKIIKKEFDDKINIYILSTKEEFNELKYDLNI